MNRRSFLQTLTAAPIVVAVIPYTKGIRTEIVAPEASEELTEDVWTQEYHGPPVIGDLVYSSDGLHCYNGLRWDLLPY